MQPIRTTNVPPTTEDIEPVQPVQMSIYKSNTYKKDLSWLYFRAESKFQRRRKQMNDKQCFTPVSVGYQAYSNSKWKVQSRNDKNNSIPCKKV